MRVSEAPRLLKAEPQSVRDNNTAVLLLNRNYTYRKAAAQGQRNAVVPNGGRLTFLARLVASIQSFSTSTSCF